MRLSPFPDSFPDSLGHGFDKAPCPTCGPDNCLHPGKPGYCWITTNSNHWVSDTLCYFGMTPPIFFGGVWAPGYSWGRCPGGPRQCQQTPSGGGRLEAY